MRILSVLNSLLLGKHEIDPFPYILLNLFLSMIAALQAPVIMMSQNRQATKDKLLAENDYQVNLKAEMEITALLRGHAEMLARIAMLERVVGRRGSGEGGSKTGPQPAISGE